MDLKITIERDEEGRYVAECPDLPGCLSEGATLEDAQENIDEAIIGCLKSRLNVTGEKLKILSFDRRGEGIEIEIDKSPVDEFHGKIKIQKELADEIIDMEIWK